MVELLTFLGVIVAISIAINNSYHLEKTLKTQIQLSLFDKRHNLYLSLEKCISHAHGDWINREINDKDIEVIQKAYNAFLQLKFLIDKKDIESIGEISKSLILLSSSKNNIKTYRDEAKHLEWCLNHQVEDAEKLKKEITDLKSDIKAAVDGWHKEFEKILNSSSALDKLFEKYLKIPYTNTECRHMYYPTM